MNVVRLMRESSIVSHGGCCECLTISDMCVRTLCTFCRDPVLTGILIIVPSQCPVNTNAYVQGAGEKKKSANQMSAACATTKTVFVRFSVFLNSLCKTPGIHFRHNAYRYRGLFEFAEKFHYGFVVLRVSSVYKSFYLFVFFFFYQFRRRRKSENNARHS